MEDATKATLRQVGRLRQEIGWPIVLVEGLVALAVGVAIFLQPDAARTTIRQLLGALLLITSALGAFAGFRAFRDGARDDLAIPARLFGGGVGVTVGLLVVIEPFSTALDESTARLLLAAGLLVYGLLDVAGWIVARVAGSRHHGALLAGVLNTVLGLLLVIYVRTEVVRVEWFGILAVAGGLLLVGYAFLLRSAGRAASARIRTAG
jgi:uncharacterized membrane protein HdeD (DUF308 family)